MAVILPEVVADSDAARKELEGEAALWQSLLTTELTRSVLFSVVERENLAALVREWELKQNRRDTADNGRPLWLGADWILIGRLSRTNGRCELGFKVLDATHGAIEASFTESFAATDLEKQTRVFSERLRLLALRCLARRDIHTLVSVLDFDSQSRFERGRWQEKALARRLRGFLQQQPGVLVLEREDVEELLRETRLRRGGLAVAGSANTNGWSNLRSFPLVSGTIIETQPEGAPMTLRVLTRVLDLNSGATNEFTGSFPVERWAEGVGSIEQRLLAVLAGETGAATNGATSPDRSAEAIALADKALRSSTLAFFMSLESLVHRRPSGVLSVWDLNAFNEGGLPGRTPGRRAKILQVVQYLKAAVLADDRNPQIKLLLASVLVDAQINDRTLAIQLAEEVGWQFPRWRRDAWGFVHAHATGELQERYRRLLAEQFPDSRFTRMPEESALAQFLEEHRGDPDLSEVMDRLRPHLDRMLTEESDGAQIEGEVRRLFELTQIIGRNPETKQKGCELQTPENRARGAALLEEMAAKHPSHGFFLFHFWSYYWDYYTDRDETIEFWLKRAADAAPYDPSDNWKMSFWWDKPRIELARRWMAGGRFKETLPYLEKITYYLLAGERDFRIGQCAFETGDFERALKVFRAFGPGHKEAAVWAAKCERALGLPPLALTARPYSVVAHPVHWSQSEVELPRGSIALMNANGVPRTNHLGKPVLVPAPPGEVRSLAVDHDFLWLGLLAPGALNAMTRATFEGVPQLRTNVLLQGGLVRWDRKFGQTRSYSTTDGLPHPWVSALAVSSEGLWVGTLAGGLGLLNPRTDAWTVWSETNGLPMNSICSLALTPDALWAGFGHLNRGAVGRLDLATRQWRTFLREDFPAHTNFPPPHVLKAQNIPPELKKPRLISHVPMSPVTAVAVIDGRLWCGVHVLGNSTDFLPHGLLVCDLATNGWYQASADAPSSIARVGDRVWVSLGASGLAHCDLRGGDWQRVTRAEGLPFDPGPICEWNGRLVIVGESVAVLNAAEKRFAVCPFPTPGAAGLMAIGGDNLYIVRGNQILALALGESRLAQP